MVMPKTRIILSYRRSDARAMAGRIRDKLASRYGDHSVYIDIDNIPFGTDFRKHIDAALGQEDIVVAIIGPKWRGEESSSQPRIMQDTDPVRVEIETALRRGLTIVPVLIDGASMPDPSTLPDSIKDLSFINAAEVDDGRDFHQHMERVVKSIDVILRQRKAGLAPAWVKKSKAWAAVAAGVVAAALLAGQLYRYSGGKIASPAPQSEIQASVKAPASPATLSPAPAPPTTPPPSKLSATRRVALVVGNSNYQKAPKLPSPAKDALAISKMLNNAGFNVIAQNDVGNVEFKRLIRRFGETLSDAEIAVALYAGHGMQLRGTNYLIPVDATLASDRDAEDEAVSLDRLVQEMGESGGRSKQLRLIMLDACRDNPFVTTMKQSRSPAGGLASSQPSDGSMLIAYASKAGHCPEGDREQSPFTQALLRSLTVPGLDVRLAFGRIRDEVLKATNNQQEPFVYGSLGGGVVALVPESGTVKAAENEMKADYERVVKIGTLKAFEVFLGVYKTGFYADLARTHIEELKKHEQKQ